MMMLFLGDCKGRKANPDCRTGGHRDHGVGEARPRGAQECGRPSGNPYCYPHAAPLLPPSRQERMQCRLSS